MSLYIKGKKEVSEPGAAIKVHRLELTERGKKALTSDRPIVLPSYFEEEYDKCRRSDSIGLAITVVFVACVVCASLVLIASMFFV